MPTVILSKRKAIITSFLILLSFSLNAQFKFGLQGSYQASFGGVVTGGGGGGYDVGLFSLGGKAQVGISDKFAGQISLVYLFRNRQNSSADIDIHYVGFNNDNPESIKISPFVGVNSSGDTNVNVGLNGTIYITDKMSFFLEPKIMLGIDSQLAIAGGLYF